MRALRGSNNWRMEFLVGYAFVLLLLSAIWLYSLLGPASQAFAKRQLDSLASVANASEVALSTSELPADEVLSRIAATENLRLTLISRDGSVLADSSDIDDAASHAERPEVEQALRGEMGFDRRVSESDNIERLYVAIPSEAVPGEAVLRVSMPVAQAHDTATGFLWTSFALMALAFALSIGTAAYSFFRVTAPVNRLERVRTDFVANASHELKTPTAGIRLLSESIRQASEDGDLEAVEQFSQRLTHEVERLQSLITDLMDLSRLEDEHQATMASDTCDLASVVATSFESHRQQAEDAQLDFVLQNHVPAGQACRVRLSVANATLLTDNLISNAIAYTEQGSVTVSLSCKDEQAILEVSDTGIGIPPADQDRIFERFYRVDTTRSRETGGTGLGLSLVRHAVQRGDGSIELESQLGQGSTFRVQLPLV